MFVPEALDAIRVNQRYKLFLLFIRQLYVFNCNTWLCCLDDCRYKFRPAPDNPYLHVPQGDSDDDLEMEEV